MILIVITEAGLGFFLWVIIFAVIGSVYNYIKKDKNINDRD